MIAYLIVIFAILGLLVSLYAFYITNRIKREKKYKPICDINENVSCKKALLSKYGSLFGISNSIIGIIFYTVILILVLFQQYHIIYLAAFLAFLASLVFAYLLITKVKSFCLVCIGIYIINFFLFVFSYYPKPHL